MEIDCSAYRFMIYSPQVWLACGLFDGLTNAKNNFERAAYICVALSVLAADISMERIFRDIERSKKSKTNLETIL